jgi:hypothetical protein
VNFDLKSVISDMNIATPTWFWIPHAWNIFFIPSLSACIYVFASKVLADNKQLGFMFSPVNQSGSFH